MLSLNLILFKFQWQSCNDSLNITFLFLWKRIVKSNQHLQRKKENKKMKKFLSSFLRCLSQLSFHLQSWCKLNPLPPRVLDHTNCFLTFTAFLITKGNSPKEDVWYRPAGETQTPPSYLIWNVSTFSCLSASHFIHSSPWPDSSVSMEKWKSLQRESQE